MGLDNDPNVGLYGLGRGNAQVVDGNGILNGYAQLLQRKQAQRQQELQQLATQQAQLKPEGLRNDEDRKDFFNQVNQWRNQAIEATNEKDPYKKAVLKAQADQAYLQAQDFASRSKEAGSTWHGFGTQLQNPVVRDRYAPDAVDKYIANNQLGINNPNYIKDPNQLEQVADHSKTLTELDGINKTLLNNTQWGTPTLVNTKVGNRNATFINNARTVDPALQLDAYGRKYDVDQNFRKTLQDLHPEIYNDQSLTPDQQKQAALTALQKNYGPIAEYSKPQEKVDATPDRWYDHYNYELRHPKPGQATANLPTPTQTMLINQAKTADPSKFLSLLPKGQYGDAKPAFSIDPQTGEHVFSFPSIVQPDKKAMAANEQLKSDYAKDPEKKGGFLGIGGKPLPFEQSTAKEDLKPETVTKSPAKTYRLNPNDPSYLSQAAQMAADQNFDATRLNQVEGIKGGHGQIPAVQGHVTPAADPGYKNLTTAKDSKGNIITLGLKNGKWYNTHTHQPVE